MAEAEIPNRALFKASEVCEIASVQPYVLRTWESEFPDLGVVKSEGAPRIYRRADVEKVLRIKQLVFNDGLTLAGVRKRIDGEAPLVLEESAAVPMKELLGRNAKERLAAVKRGLIGILAMLGGNPAIHAARTVPKAARDRNGSRATSRPVSKPAVKSNKKRSSRR